MITTKWIKSFIKRTQKNWDDISLSNSNILPHTGWLKGVNDFEIRRMEEEIGFRIPHDVKCFLSLTSGLDKEQKQIGYVGDKKIIKFVNNWHLNPQRIKEALVFLKSWIDKNTYRIIKEENIIDNIHKENFFLLPIYSHRFVICDQEDLDISTVISVYDNDVVIYGENLQEYLVNEFLKTEKI